MFSGAWPILDIGNSDRSVRDKSFPWRIEILPSYAGHFPRTDAVRIECSANDAASCVVSSGNERCFNHTTIVLRYASILANAHAALLKSSFCTWPKT